MKFLTEYNIDDTHSAKYGTTCPEPTLTQQADRHETDINYIMKRYEKTGQLPAPRTPGIYGDFTGASDYRTTLDQLTAAQDTFMALPANTRKYFNNNPAELLEFVNNKANREKAIELGLIDKPIPATTTEPAQQPAQESK